MTEIRYQVNRELPKADIIVFPLHKGEEYPPLLKELDRLLDGGVEYNKKLGQFDGSKGQLVVLTTNGKAAVPKVILLGVGEKDKLCPESMYRMGQLLLQQIPHDKSIQLAIDITHLEDHQEWENLILAVRLESWTFKKYMTIQPHGSLNIICLCSNPNQAKKMKEHQALFEGATLAKNLSAEPANVMYPKVFADHCSELKKEGIVVQTLDRQKLKELGANAILAVASGSPNSPYLVTMEWKGNPKSEETIAIVGKGVCYDSGGINLKTENQVEMKWDKAAAATVTGLMKTIALLKLPLNVVGVIGLVENMPDGASVKPGDVIKTLSGKTVEIVDTDCEGRLVLADCLWYAQTQYKVSKMIDLGTIAPDTCAALAAEYAGLFSENHQLAGQLLQAGWMTGERVWQLPMGEGFAKQIESNVADMKNSGTYLFGDGSAAAEFLACFVNKELPWAHLDIAGVAWTDDKRTSTKNVTGYGVRLLFQWLQSLK